MKFAKTLLLMVTMIAFVSTVQCKKITFTNRSQLGHSVRIELLVDGNKNIKKFDVAVRERRSVEFETVQSIKVYLDAFKICRDMTYCKDKTDIVHMGRGFFGCFDVPSYP